MKRLKSPVTTALAILVLLLSFVLVWFGKATFSEVSALVLLAAGLLFSDDKLFKENFFGKKKDLDEQSTHDN